MFGSLMKNHQMQEAEEFVSIGFNVGEQRQWRIG